MTSRFEKSLLLVRTIAVVVTCGAVTWSVIKIGQTAPPALSSLGKTAGTLSTNLQHLDTQLNGPKGLLPQTTAVLSNANGAVTEVRADVRTAAWKINGNGKNYDGLITQVYKDTHDVHALLARASIEQADAYHSMAGDTHAFMVALTTDVNDIHPLILSLTERIDDLGKLINDPDITAALKSLAQTSADTEKFTASMDAIILDVQGKIHEETHPTKKKKLLGDLLTALKMLYYLSQIFHIP